MKDQIFTFRLSKTEQQGLDTLAVKLQRSRSDSLRYLIANAEWLVDFLVVHQIGSNTCGLRQNNEDENDG